MKKIYYTPICEYTPLQTCRCLCDSGKGGVEPDSGDEKVF